MSTEESTVSTRASARLHAHRPARGRKTYIVAALLLLLALVAGMIIGGGAVVLHFRKGMFPTPPRPEEVGEQMFKRLSNTVELNEDEKTKARERIMQCMIRVKSIRDDSFQEMKGEFDALREELGAMLGPERGKAWEEENKRFMERRKHRPSPSSDRIRSRHGSRDERGRETRPEERR